MKLVAIAFASVVLFAPLAAHAEPRTSAFVHLGGADSATIERRSTSGSWETVCYAPCDRDLPLGVEYRVAGDGVRASSPFYLDRDKPRIELDARAAGTSGHHAGVALAAAGGAAVALGLTLVGAAYWAQTEANLTNTYATLLTGHEYQAPLDTGLVVGGVVTAVVGALLAATGIVVVASNRKTSVDQVAFDPRVAPRAPTWREASRAPSLAPRPTTFAIGGSF